MKKEKKKLFITLTTIILFIAIFLFGATSWMVMNFGDVSFGQYYFSVTAPTAGTPMSTYLQIAMYVGIIIVATIVTSVIFYLIVKKWNVKLILKKSILLVTSFLMLGYSVYYTNVSLKIGDYFFSEDTEFFETNYVKPTTSNVKFPEKKKNLVYIFLESFESTFFSEELGGAMDQNLLPNLTNMINEESSISFSQGDKMGGGFQAPETGYSIAGMFAQQSGLPFKVPVKGNDYGTQNEFITGAVTLGDILEKEGYNLQFMAGTDGTFAGVDNMYETHGNFDVFDHKKAKEEGKIPPDYKVWWGYEDSKLYEYSKEKLDMLSQQPEPFAMVIETTDSHFPDGYTDATCPQFREFPYENSIACADQMVGEFVNYLKQQPYYEDTVIVIQGDHLSMDHAYFEAAVDPAYPRRIFNAYINVDPVLVNAANDKNRNYYSMDVFPTILSSMDVKIDGDRLGIGTDLFSKTPTFYEYYGIDEVNVELDKKSEYFFDTFLYSRTKYE